MNIYFDNAATTAVRAEAAGIMSEVMTEDYGNPSAMHDFGRRASARLENARRSIAGALDTGHGSIYFTSGGTEANNLAISGILKNRNLIRKGRHIITSAVEHSSVSEPIKKLADEGFDVTKLLPDDTGRIPAPDFARALREDTVFASVMLVNNETGALNPVAGYANAIKRRGLGTILHTDAVQGFGKLPFTAKSLGTGIVSVSSHKIHGPKGAGALYVSPGLKLSPLLVGGAQEKGIRAGTEALPAIAGFGRAAELAMAELDNAFEYVRDLRCYALKQLNTQIPQAVIIGSGDSPYILCVSLPGFKSEVLLNYLSGEGIYVSKGSACKKGARSPVLEAMGLRNDIIDGALRVSFSRYNTREEIDCFIKALKKATETLAH